MEIIEDLRKQIKTLEAQIRFIQDSCEHDAEVSFRADTGNYDRSSDQFYIDYRCIHCDKRWTVTK